MRKILASLFLAIFFCVFTFFTPEVARASEEITAFDSHITINKDTSIRIEETIQFTTTEFKHGIYRYIPIRYSRNGANYTTRVRDISIRDEEGKTIPFSQSYESGNINLKIGDADKTFTGKKTYFISYTVENAVQQVRVNKNAPLTPELYWDITGEGWQIEIAHSTATIDSPDAKILTAGCYSGTVGSTDSKCRTTKVSATQATIDYSEPINYGDNLTVALGLDPAGGLVFPTGMQKLLKTFTDNLNVLPLLIPGILMTTWWWRRGRDKAFVSWNVFDQDASQPQITTVPWSSRAAPMVYEPIKDLTPGEIGALHDEKVDNQDVIAEIVDLARQKLLKIERIEKKTLFWSEPDYLFTKTTDAPKNLSAHQAYLHKSIFLTGESVKMSDLKGSFYTHIEKTKKMIFESLLKQKMFVNNPEKTRELGFAVAAIVTFITAYWMFNLMSMGIFISLPIFAVSAIAAFLSANQLPAKTALGTNYAWQGRGLRRTIQYGAWREKISEKHLFFEEMLPFAVALGVVAELSRDMEKLNVKPPEYLANGGLNSWTTASFINSFSSQANSNLTYNPSSSNWSSGSGSSGGSSGGGGGGGGGGSW